MRGVIFVDKSVAELLYYADAYAFGAPKEFLPVVTPKQFRELLNSGYEVGENYIVELEVAKDTPVYGFAKSQLIAVHKYISPGVYDAYLTFKQPSMFGKRTNVLTDDIGWTHPIAGMTLAENKENMQEWAYNYMLKKLSKRQGEVYEKCIETALYNYPMTESVIKEYYL